MVIADTIMIAAMMSINGAELFFLVPPSVSLLRSSNTLFLDCLLIRRMSVDSICLWSVEASSDGLQYCHSSVIRA